MITAATSGARGTASRHFTGPRSLALLAALAASACSEATIAGTDSGGPPSVRVRTTDLNLSTPEGLDTLRHRIHTAAGQVCSDAYPLSDLQQAMMYHHCVTVAFNRTMDHVQQQLAQIQREVK
jgi:UrcA family protein